MRTLVRISITAGVFAVFYAGAFLLMQGANEFEKKVEMALFSNKIEAAAITNAEAYEHPPVVIASNKVWK